MKVTDTAVKGIEYQYTDEISREMRLAETKGGIPPSEGLPAELRPVYELAKQLHGPTELTQDAIENAQERKAGRFFIWHPYETAMLLRHFKLSYDEYLVMAAAALMHDGVEDNKDVEIEDVANEFCLLMDETSLEPDYVADSWLFIQVMTNEYEGLDGYIEYIEELKESPQVVLLKICDLIHNVIIEPMPREVLAGKERKLRKRELQIATLKDLCEYYKHSSIATNEGKEFIEIVLKELDQPEECIGAYPGSENHDYWLSMVKPEELDLAA